MKQPLTVIVPCKNEQLNIRACIESFYSIADEIVIADSGSTDATLEIARQFDNVRIIERDYKTSGDFKNWAIPQATHEWVLIVDADERIKSDLAEEIVMCLSRGPEFDGYWIFRENHFLGHRQMYGDARTDSVLRLFHRDRGRYFGPSDHGEVRIDTGRVGKLEAKMAHFSAWGYDQLYQKNDRYTKLQALQWNEAGKEVSYFKLLIGPMWRFFREYILQRSILDGKVGIQTAWVAAFYSFNKQARLWEIKHGLEQQDLDAIVFREMESEFNELRNSEFCDAPESKLNPAADNAPSELADGPIEESTSIESGGIESRRAA
ncbi:MAG: glycosyltransferase family 2 protein [Mariniblastus sp.]|nr:glycosyltransferase family 2 protein [Mariniblastus sp.]